MGKWSAVAQQTAVTARSGWGGPHMARPSTSRCIRVGSVAVAVLLSVLGSVTHAAAGTLPDPDPDPTGSNPSRTWTAADDLNTLLDGLTSSLSQAMEPYGQLFTGVEITDDGNIIADVGPNGLNGQLQQVVNDLHLDFAGVSLTWRSVANPIGTLETAQDQVSSDIDSWQAQRVDIQSWGPDISTGLLNIELGNYTDSAAAQLTAAYGSNLVEVAPAHTNGMPTQFAMNRYNDSLPWWGSDELGDYPGRTYGHADCTAGAGLHDASGTYYVTTAGHCGAAGHVFYNGQTRLGSILRRSYAQRGPTDAALIKVTSGFYVYDGFHIDPPQPGEYSDYAHYSRVIGAKTTAVAKGTLVCYDGANSGQMCDAKVVNPSRCQLFDGGTPYAHTACGLVETYRVYAAAQPGDSGGPVYQGRSATTVVIFGQIVGGDEWHYDYYTPERAVLAAFSSIYPGLTVNRG